MNLLKIFVRTSVKLICIPVLLLVLTFIGICIYFILGVRWVFMAPFNLILWSFDEPVWKDYMVENAPAYTDFVDEGKRLLKLLISDFVK